MKLMQWFRQSSTTCQQNGIKNKVKQFICGSFLVLSLIGLILGPTNSFQLAKGEGITTPRFNFLQGDAEMLRVAKTTDGVWGDPISANVGDRVAFLFYYHNGIVNSTAHHTTLRVDLPTGVGTQLVAQSWLWSAETSPINDTVVNGQIVGLSGATINLASAGRIEYVPGSTKWFPNGTQTPTAVADGITSSAGLDIGDINGCWPFAGYVTFLADIKSQAQLVMTKEVTHPGDANWHPEISANPGDQVAYRVGVRNDGGTTATAVTVKDTLPAHMTYLTGTTYLYTKEHPEGIKQADTLFTSGLSLPNIIPGADGTVFLTYKTVIDMSLPSGSLCLVNLAQVFMGGVLQAQASAKVNVTAQRGLVIDKLVSNGVSWVKQNTAKLGDRIDYRISIKNTGNVPIDGVRVKDILPVFVKYIDGSTKVDGTTVADGITTDGGISIDTLAPGVEKIIVLSGTVVGCPPVGGYTLTNTAYAWGNGVTEINSSAVTIVNITAPLPPKI